MARDEVRMTWSPVNGWWLGQLPSLPMSMRTMPGMISETLRRCRSVYWGDPGRFMSTKGGIGLRRFGREEARLPAPDHQISSLCMLASD